jgi:DNA-binding transcriptional ArsR family regulator
VVGEPVHPRLRRARAAGGADVPLGTALAALADPTRRGVVALIARGPQRAGDIAAALATSPATLSRHLRRLKRGGLIADDEPEHDARVRLYRLQPQALVRLQRWLAEPEAFWGYQLQAFKAHAEAGMAPRKARGRR